MKTKTSAAKLTLKQTLSLLKSESFPNELYQDVDEAVEISNKKLNIYLTLADDARKRADKALKDKTPWLGVPIAVKDNICTKDLRTTASSTVLENFVPQFDATVSKRLKEAGGVVYGKTNLDAWAHGSSTETSQFGRTLNPRNPEHLPGGSSGGSAAAVAADMCIAAIGTETAGSIRQPAAWCGVVLKPTMAGSAVGTLPWFLHGLTVDKTTEDATIVLYHLSGRDPLEGTTANRKCRTSPRHLR